LENFGGGGDVAINRPWKSIQENIKASVVESLGYEPK
jgi:hypothetical protein